MDHHEQVALELEDNAFTHTPEPKHALPCCFGDGRIERANEEGTWDNHALEGLVHDPRREVLEVEDDIRKLGHEGCWATTSLSRHPHQLGPSLRIEAGSTHEHPIDLRPSKEREHIAAVHTAAVQDGYTAGNSMPPQLQPDELVDLRRVIRSRVLSRPDC